MDALAGYYLNFSKISNLLPVENLDNQIYQTD